MSELPMRPEAESDQLHLALTEIRHLQDTISALRQELEKLQADKEESVQRAVGSSNNRRDEL